MAFIENTQTQKYIKLQTKNKTGKPLYNASFHFLIIKQKAFSPQKVPPL